MKASKYSLLAQNTSYFQRRLDALGIRPAQNLLPEKYRWKTLSAFFEEDQHGNILINYTDLEGKPMLFQNRHYQGRWSAAQPDYYRRTRYRMPFPDKESGKRIKYHSPKGSEARPYFPGLLIAGMDRASIETLVITEGEFKAVSACMHGIPTVGISGIHMAVRTKDEAGEPIPPRLLPELQEFIEQLPKLQHIVLLHDADAREGDQERRRNFYAAVRNFYEAARPLGKHLHYAHIHEELPKGIDDLLIEYPDAAPAVRQALLEERQTDEVFHFAPLDSPEHLDLLAAHFCPRLSLREDHEHHHPDHHYLTTDMVLPLLREAMRTKSRLLIECDTGRGKTTVFMGENGIMDILRKEGKNAVFLSPYVVTAKKHAVEFQATYFRHGTKNLQIERAITNYDQLLHLMTAQKIDVVIMDETPRAFDHYRRNLHTIADLLFAQQTLPVIGLTATPGPEKYLFHQIHRFYLSPRPKMKTRVYHLKKGESGLKAVKLLASKLEGKVMIRLSTFPDAHQIAKSIRGASAVCSPNNPRHRESDHHELEQIINCGAFQSRVLCTTPYLDEGVSIRDVRHAVMLNCYDPDAIRQFSRRCREEGVTLHLVYSGKKREQEERPPHWAFALEEAWNAAAQLASQYNNQRMENDSGHIPNYHGNAVRWNGEAYSVSLPALISGEKNSDNLSPFAGIHPRMVAFFRSHYHHFTAELSRYFDLEEATLDGVKYTHMEAPEQIDELAVRDEVIAGIGAENSIHPPTYEKWEQAREHLRRYALPDDLRQYESRSQINREYRAARTYYHRMLYLKGECTSAAEKHQYGELHQLFLLIQKARRVKAFKNAFKMSELTAYVNQNRETKITAEGLGVFIRRTYQVEDVNKEKHTIRLVKPRKFDFKAMHIARLKLRGSGVNLERNSPETMQEERA
jgi:hypothetical protein